MAHSVEPGVEQWTAQHKKTLFDWLFPPVLILFLINILIPRGSIRVALGQVLPWLVLLIFIVMPLSPLWSIVKTAGYLLTGRVHFPSHRLGETIVDEKGRPFRVFRQVVVDAAKGKLHQPEARLTLHFRVTNMSPEVNKFYSLLPLALYIGDRGFRSKLFTIQGEYCQSIYEWDTLQDAENYINSLALKTILLRSVPGSFSYDIKSM